MRQRTTIPHPDQFERPTQTLGMFTDDAARTQALPVMSRELGFRKGWNDPVVGEAMRSDIDTHYDSATAALGGKHVIGVTHLQQDRQEGGHVARTFASVEIGLRWVCQPAVRQAFRNANTPRP